MECLALREHLLAQVHNTHPVALKAENLQPSSSASPHDQNIDPAIAGSGIMSVSTGESGGDENGSESKKGSKRELSTSKRAAQNRQAQVCIIFASFSVNRFLLKWAFDSPQVDLQFSSSGFDGVVGEKRTGKFRKNWRSSQHAY